MHAVSHEISDIDASEAFEVWALPVGSTATYPAHVTSRAQLSPKWVGELRRQIKMHSAGVRCGLIARPKAVIQL